MVKKSHSPQKTAQIIEIPHERSFPEDSFFTVRETISNIQRRLYGISHTTKEISNLRKTKNIDVKNEKLSQIIHQNENLSNIIAFSSHNGRNWQRDGILKMQRWLLNQVSGGRAMEILLTEAMMRVSGKSSNGYHFRPEKDIDMRYKIDMISRLPYYKKDSKKLETLSFWSQITMASIENIEENPESRYAKKYHQMRQIVPFLENNMTREEMENIVGRLNVPDVVSYIALNGLLARKIATQNQNPALDKFRKWRKNNFNTDGLLDYFDNDFHEKIIMVANELLKTQQFLMSENFLQKSFKKWSGTENINENYKKEIDFLLDTKELSVKIFNKEEILAKFTFFISEKVFGKIYDINDNEE